MFYLLLAWTIVHTLVYVAFISDIRTKALLLLCDVPSLEGMKDRGYTGARLVNSRKKRIDSLLKTSRECRVVYYGATALYMAISPVGSFLIYSCY